MPKKTPESVVAKINAAVVEALSDATVRRRLNELEVEISAARAADARGTCGTAKERD